MGEVEADLSRVQHDAGVVLVSVDSGMEAVREESIGAQQKLNGGENK
jgi:hypothetical protein